MANTSSLTNSADRTSDVLTPSPAEPDVLDTAVKDPSSECSRAGQLPSDSSDTKSRPTDSMFTVPLSDTDILPASHAASAPESSNTTKEAEGPHCYVRSSSISTISAVPSNTSHGDADLEERSDPSSGSPVQSAMDDLPTDDNTITISSRSSDSTSENPEGVAAVDWDGLGRSEEQEPRNEGSDEVCTAEQLRHVGTPIYRDVLIAAPQSTAFLLARLEQENNALATDPKAALSKTRDRASTARSQKRPPSIQHLKKLINDPASSLRYSLLPAPPPMTELEFWAAVVADYPRTAQSLPTLLSKKIRRGVPPPLRGVVWSSMAGARNRFLEDQYDRLAGEPSPYESLIGKDVGRSFPGVEMFRDADGEGQRMLGLVLKCFSLYDHKIGYCQGLGFLVGPLLMHMGAREAFCVLISLMEHYNLRSCFLPDLSGLHLRIYQFQHLLTQYHPQLSSHLEGLQIEPGYVSQWFLSFFAVTCPLPMLLRIYDIIFAEGASETLMRVALSLMRRNEAKILACTEVEDIMHLLLSRGLWDVYACNADDLVNDFVGLTGVVTHESLQALEDHFKESQNGDSKFQASPLPDFQAAASRFLGRIWAASNTSTKSMNLSPGLSAPSRPGSFLCRSPSKQSIASTLNSVEGGSDSSAITVQTDLTVMSRQSSVDCTSLKSLPGSAPVLGTPVPKTRSRDRDLHGQIEDLLTALSEMQRTQAIVTSELQKEREEREEDQKVVNILLNRLNQQGPMASIAEVADEEASAKRILEEATAPDGSESRERELKDVIDAVVDRFSTSSKSRRSSILETKQQVRDDVRRAKDQYRTEASRCRDLDQRLTEQNHEVVQLREDLRDARLRLQGGHRDRPRKNHASSSDDMPEISPATSESRPVSISTPAGLREFKLNRSGSVRGQAGPVFSKRTSSLQTPAMCSNPEWQVDPPPTNNEESLLAELVASKTAEAVAKQEAEELRAKLESLRKMIGASASAGGKASAVGTAAGSDRGISPSGVAPSRSTAPEAVESVVTAAATVPASGGGGFWTGWGKRSVSSTPPTATTGGR
ncbi:MAG: hypothetical protein M1817_002005 [Caeruleum heppii]|nr:MAG: hypothetical protein M1817_002005 [Caeruleum heppii]